MTFESYMLSRSSRQHNRRVNRLPALARKKDDHLASAARKCADAPSRVRK